MEYKDITLVKLYGAISKIQECAKKQSRGVIAAEELLGDASTIEIIETYIAATGNKGLIAKGTLNNMMGGDGKILEGQRVTYFVNPTHTVNVEDILGEAKK